MSNNLWGHALQLAGSGERRVRAAVSARFLSAIPRTDPLHTLYATRNNAQPHANTVSNLTIYLQTKKDKPPAPEHKEK